MGEDCPPPPFRNPKYATDYTSSVDLVTGVTLPLKSLYKFRIGRLIDSCIHIKHVSRPWPLWITWHHRRVTIRYSMCYFLYTCSIVTESVSVTWRHRTRDRLIPQVPVSYRCATVTSLYVSMSSRFRNTGRQTYRGHDLDISRSRDVINHVSIWFAICRFVLMILWNQAFISIGFRDICIQTYLDANDPF